MTCRNATTDYGSNELIYNGIEYGQTRKLNGYYIGLLATEYKLLIDNGQVSDAATTLNELNSALEALNRMDECETKEPWNLPFEANNGFFIRNDVPAILSENMEAALNNDLDFGDFNKYLNQIGHGYYGLPFSIDKHNVLAPRKYQDASNYYFSHYYSDFNLTDYLNDHNLNGHNQYSTYWKAAHFTSNDEIIGTMMGLSLVCKLVDDYSIRQKAYSIAATMRDFAYGQVIPFQMFYPDLTPISSGSGGNSASFFWGMDCSVKAMNPDFFINERASLSKALYALSISYYVHSGTQNNFYNRGLFSKLVAMSNSTGYFLSPEAALWEIGDDGRLQTFYLLLWAVLNNRALENYPYYFLLEDLNLAPCGGPYKYIYPSTIVATGWANEYKYDASLQGQMQGGGRTGVFPGADYMLLYNLACLAFPNGFDYEGQHYSFPYYINQIDRPMLGQYAPLFVPASATPLIASTTNPAEYRAISSITTDMKISNQAMALDPNSQPSVYYIPNVFGDVTMKAGESIKLTDGFRVDAGAHFLARIESYSCGGLSYKNMAAPPWSENYRGSYYDTLISVPMDQRAPIVYAEDNYEEEDFDMSLWEDYYMYDTTAATELAVGVWLNPNPCANKTTLTLVSESEQFLTIELFEMTGQKRATLFEGTADNNFTLDVDMSFYAKGMYLLRISGAGGSKVVRFVKE